MNYAQYFHYLPTGEILSTGSCPEHEVDIQVPLPGAKVANGAADWSADYYDVATKTVRKKPQRPSEFHEFDYLGKSWRFNSERAWASVRAARDAKLLATDWTQLPDVPLQAKEAWAAYRQALRDVTKQPDPLKVVWPEPPTT